MSTKRIWHPAHDGITPIANAIRAWMAEPPPQLDDLHYTTRRPSMRLASVIEAPQRGAPGGASGRREMATNWLRSNGFQSDAAEFANRLAKFRENLRQWELKAKEAAERRMFECSELENAGQPVNAIDRFGEAVYESANDLSDEAHYLADYLDQLAATITGKIEQTATRSPTSDIDPFAPYFPAAHFDHVHGIKRSRLYEAARSNPPRLPAKKVGQRWHYSEPGARELWPNDMADAPNRAT